MPLTDPQQTFPAWKWLYTLQTTNSLLTFPGGEAGFDEQPFVLRLVLNQEAWWHQIREMRKYQTGCSMYIFGNHYDLVT